MTSVQLYCGGGEFEDIALANLFARLELSRAALADPFAAERIEVIGDVSKRLLADRRTLNRPAIAYFAHWTRPAALRDLARRFEATSPPDVVCVPRGVALHIPPKNVETIFLFSWTLAYLAGNANLVRLPAQVDSVMLEVIDLLVERLRATQQQTEYFVRYPADDAINAALCGAADARLVWGGDAKVAAFEKFPLRNGGKAIWFGDRYSYALISGEALEAIDGAELKRLARNVFVDIFTFDQMGCSSPHKIYIHGDRRRHRQVVAALADAVQEEAARSGTNISASHSIRKIAEAFALAAENPGADVAFRSGELTTVVLPAPRRAEDRLGGGFLTVEFIDDLNEVIAQIRSKHQTITHYGIKKDALSEIARRGGRFGLSRIVPVGQALDFDAVWDGYDLLRELTRSIRLR